MSDYRTFDACDLGICTSCGGPTIDADQSGVCRPCATLAHNLKLMAAGVTRDKATGRYTKVGKK